VRAALSRALAWLEARIRTRKGTLALLVLALAIFALQSVALSIYPGRDLASYLVYYLQIWKVGTVLPAEMLFRTPVAPLAIGIPADLGGGWLLEVWMALLFAGSIVAWRTVALEFGPRAALLVSAALLAYPGYGILFHAPSSDPIFAAGFAGWAVLVARAARRPSVAGFAVVGLGVAGLALIRPGNQVFLAFCVFPLFLAAPWRLRLGRAAALFAAGAIPLAAWSGYNDVRYDDFTVSRAGPFTFFRAFVTDRIVAPENGSASREVAAAVRTHLLPNEPYRSRGITLPEFFSSGSIRMEDDLLWLSNRVWGWDSNYSKLRSASFEAIRRHPGTYARGVAGTTWHELWWPLFSGRGLDRGGGAAAPRTLQARSGGAQGPSSDEEPIPSSYQGANISTPDNRIREVWTSPTEHHRVYRNPADARRDDELGRELGRLTGRIHPHGSSAGLAHRLDQVSRWYPRPVLWLVVGLAAGLVRRPRRFGLALALAAMGLVVVVFTALGYYAVVQYAVPVVPAFILLAAAGLVGRRDVPAGVTAPRFPP
jgi:hypothetical protein